MFTADALTKLFSKVLGISCGASDSFFDLGGDSLSAVELTTELSALAGARFDISLLLDYQTPSELAARLNDIA
ncbi:MAG: non-ribosomal peptide synthetase [Cypionkella sp.]|uniref:acyl carrier protein n=1 Tax=Cypionkella sp. TaxID=2811411 RepID=UPI00260ED217|nr:acyl carrier protein [Cypionkella sp.]MDB5661194.1 non-ribosomal peptide synthetase [Cypionkella sp.]